MNKILLIGFLILTSIFLMGCGHYGDGESVGYITTIEDNRDLIIFPTKSLWFRAELESSQTDCYRMNENLEEVARVLSEQKVKVKIIYERHYVEFGCSNDRVKEIRPLG